MYGLSVCNLKLEGWQFSYIIVLFAVSHESLA